MPYRAPAPTSSPWRACWPAPASPGVGQETGVGRRMPPLWRTSWRRCWGPWRRTAGKRRGYGRAGAGPGPGRSPCHRGPLRARQRSAREGGRDAGVCLLPAAGRLSVWLLSSARGDRPARRERRQGKPRIVTRRPSSRARAHAHGPQRRWTTVTHASSQVRRERDRRIRRWG